MVQDPLYVSPLHRSLIEDMDKLKRLAELPSMIAYREMQQLLESNRLSHLHVLKEASALASSPFMEVVRANQHLIELAERVRLENQLLANHQLIHPTWLDQIKTDLGSLSHLQVLAQKSLIDASYRVTLAERLFAGIDFEALRRTVAYPEYHFSQIESVIDQVTLTYGKLADSIRTLPDMAHLPAFALPGATREVFTTGYALDVITIWDVPERERDPSEVQLVIEVEQETAGCIALLQAIDPALARPYIGARDALRGKNADRARHILSSLRELWNHLLRRLAPDQHILSWVSKDDKELLHEGRPTRKARVLYVCRSINHDPLTDFIVQDTRALMKLVEFFNRVHELELELTDEQLRALLLKTDSWLMYILQIAQEA